MHWNFFWQHWNHYTSWALKILMDYKPSLCCIFFWDLHSMHLASTVLRRGPGCASPACAGPVILRQSAESRDESQLAWLGMTDRQSSNPSIIHLFPRLKQIVIQLMQQKNQHCHVTVTARCQHTGPGQCCKLGQHFICFLVGSRMLYLDINHDL